MLIFIPTNQSGQNALDINSNTSNVNLYLISFDVSSDTCLNSNTSNVNLYPDSQQS